MTDLQHYQPRDIVEASSYGRLNGAVEPVSGLPPAAQALTEWAVALRSAKQIADALAPTSFCPQGFRGKPAEAAAAILAGSEVGLSPRAALNSFDVIQGVAAPRAMALRAIVQSKGHEVWVVESTATRAIVRGKRAGSDQVHESVWTMDRARGLGLHTKDNWKKQQGAMLVARATAECCRLVAADAILGIPYAAEELDDGGSTVAPEQPKRTAQRRTVRAKASVERPTAPEPDLPELADEPDLPDEDERPALPAAQAAGEGPTAAQMKKLAVMFGKAGITDRDKRLRISSQLVRRELGSSKDMTKAEASDLIDTLEDLENQGPLGQMIEDLLAAAAPADDDSQYLPGDPDLTAHERGDQ